ncbi:MAG: tyrosine-type recombinase/integrase [Opitutaceae bacterium]|nr:tyrosine-type recombinase/integrase [Opitutaceae bacterium]
MEQTGGYYALLKRADKQFRRSLKTKDRKLADRRLAELRAQVGNLSITEDARLSFDEIAQRWFDTTAHALKASTVTRRRTCLKNLSPFFAGVAIRNIQPHHCERWLTERGARIAPQTMVHELNALRNVLDYAVSLGLMLSNPAKGIKRRKVVQAPMVIPTREQFRRLIETIRQSDGRLDSQQKAKPGAAFVELLAYSGCRLHEAASLVWSDADFDKGTLSITGGERGTKNHEVRTIPMTDALCGLLLRMKEERKPQPSDRIAQFGSARKCLITACRRLGYPEFTHHDFRHFFATTCIESGVDIPTVSRWLGHKDGGALAMRVYGHLRQEHSLSAAKKVTF